METKMDRTIGKVDIGELSKNCDRLYEFGA